MTIGILTYWWSQTNYGQILQCYALQKYLRVAGHKVFIIRYNFESELYKTPLIYRIKKAFNPIKLVRYLKRKFDERTAFDQTDYSIRQFDRFRNENIIFSEKLYLSYNELVNDPPVADLYIVGSDQVWNPSCLGGEQSYNFKNIVNANFLNFGKAKKMSYAASWGTTDITDNYCHLATNLLRKFSFVSVREKTGVEICKKCGYKDAKLVCDPTMLLSADYYRELYGKHLKKEKKKPYIFCYLLNNTTDIKIDSIYNFAKSNSLEVIYVTGNSVVDTYEKTNATIQEWLYYIDNAKYVITNSFHCGVFSTIFNKSYAIIPLTGKFSCMNSRFDSLFDYYGIEQRYTDSTFSILNTSYTINIKKNNDFDLIKFIKNELDKD